MSGKLIVHKFETGINFKSLHITINEDDNDVAETKFSEWLDGKTYQKRKDLGKSARLVVKIVSGEELRSINLDSCAKELNAQQDIFSNNITRVSTENYNQNIPRNVLNKPDDISSHVMGMLEFNNKVPNRVVTGSNLISRSIYNQSTANQADSSNKLKNTCPLEYSLEKVKENNARIMENIQMLNRTLNYTKKKEILDIVCPIKSSIPTFPCHTCGKCFVYETGLRRHYSTRHAISETQPRWQIVWTCGECFQVWPRQDLAVKHCSQCCRSDNIECVREIKASSLMQCEFCEKVYTSIPRLLRHSKMHVTARNYECKACDTSFFSYKAAEQHWLTCPWLKMFYNFALPKLLLCNACDRKFRNYDQLYIHRYKVGHFMGKAQLSKSINSIGNVVYQCELCGQWFPTTSLLKVHRREYHPRYDVAGQYNIDSNYHANGQDFKETEGNENEDLTSNTNFEKMLF